MNSTTLRGVFPEPKPVYKRNFIKENVKHIKEMQGILQNSGLFEARTALKPMKAISQFNPPNRMHKPVAQSRSLPISKSQRTGRKQSADQSKGGILPELKIPDEQIEKHSHRGVQTESPEDLNQLYENGIIKYPSPGVLKALASNRSPIPKSRITQVCRGANDKDRGDSNGIVVPNPHNENLTGDMQSLDINDKHDFIKENILALRQKAPRQEAEPKTPNYQIGVLPKYLRDRKEEQQREMECDTDCPEGHVLLPNDERKETLRVLRQSYADRIQELNAMPVRNDTLRMRKRKMAIEEELKKIDEGIKVFQRPKVFVKINA